MLTVEAFYNLLDHRLAFRARTPPYDLGQIPDAAWVNDGDPGTPADEYPLTNLLATVPRGVRPGEGPTLTLTEFLAFASYPLPLDDSALRRFYGIEPEHVAGALAMMRNLLQTMDVEYRARNAVDLEWGFPAYLATIDPLAVRPPDPHVLSAALQNVGLWSSNAIYADPTSTMWMGADSGNIYMYDSEVSPGLGAALTLHVVRIHLARLRNSERSWLVDERGTLGEATELLQSYVGDHWVEYKRHEEFDCDTWGELRENLCDINPDTCPDCVTAGTCSDSDTAGFLCLDDPPTAPALTDIDHNEIGHVDVFFPRADPVFAAYPNGDGQKQGRAVLVAPNDGYCFQYGHRPDGSTCAGVTSTPLNETIVPELDSVPAAEVRLGYGQRRFVVPLPEQNWSAPEQGAMEDSKAYVFWRTGDPMVAEYDPSARYILIDVIQPWRNASVHILGGRFAEMFVDAMATDPSNPGRPAIASLGFGHDFVPPLEHELISDGDAIEDSYQTYINNASEAAAVAESQLTAARAAQLNAILDDRADLALLAEAELAEDEAISEACGSEGGCDLPRTDSVRLGDLIYDGSPLVEPPDASDIPGFDHTESVGTGDVRIVLSLDYKGTDVDDHVGTDDVENDNSHPTCGEHLANFTSSFNPGDYTKHEWDSYTKSYLSAGLGCMRYMLLTAAYHAELQEVPDAVIAELAAGGSGEFRDASGLVRDELINMFGHIVELREALRSFEATYTAAIADIDNGARQIDQLTPTGEESFLCHFGHALAIVGTVIAAAASTIVTFGAGAAVIAAVVIGLAAAAATVASQGVTWEQTNCEGDTRPAQAVAEQTFANAVISLENLRGITDRVRLAAGNVALGDARIDRLQRNAEIARQRREIRELVANTNSITDLPEWHALQTYQVRRARRALFRAQQYAFIARRAVEYRFGVDLAVMTQSEPFVDAPATWANELFVLDTATSADPDMPGTDHVNASGEAVADWVQQLQDFVRGYPFGRRMRDATESRS